MDEPASENKSVKRPKDPLHGVTLEKMLNSLVDQLGWDEMARRVKIACFIYHPSISLEHGSRGRWWKRWTIIGAPFQEKG